MGTENEGQLFNAINRLYLNLKQYVSQPSEKSSIFLSRLFKRT